MRDYNPIFATKYMVNFWRRRDMEGNHDVGRLCHRTRSERAPRKVTPRMTDYAPENRDQARPGPHASFKPTAH
jgi:hypothetical protein